MAEPIESRNLLAALAYLLGAPGALVCLWRGGEEPFVRFHAWQSILLSLTVIVLGAALLAVPLVGRPLALVAAATLIGVGLFVAARAYRGHWTAIPLLGDLAIASVPPRHRH